MSKITHIETKDGFEHYKYEFFIKGKLNEDDGSTYGGINAHDEVVQLIREQFYFELVKFAYNLNIDNYEDVSIFMEKIFPENFKN